MTRAVLLALVVLAAASPAFAINGRPEDSVSALSDACALGTGSQASYTPSLHIAAIFVVFISSSIGITLPFLPKLVRGLSGRAKRYWDEAFFVLKYAGAGVIIATAFVHLTYESFMQLASPCLSLAYPPMAPALSMASLFLVFFIDCLLTRHIHRCRKATEKVIQHRRALHAARTQESMTLPTSLNEVAGEQMPDGQKVPNEEWFAESLKMSDVQFAQENATTEAKLNQKAKEMEIVIIEGGIVFHSVMVGLGLGTSSDVGFIPYFIAIVFHQFFDGCAIGTRMVDLDFTGRRKKQFGMFAAYAFVTPIGIAIGTGVRQTFEPNDPSTILVIGILDSLSAGVLLYGALVDLLAKDFLAGPMLDVSDKRLSAAFGSLLLGAAVMSLLGKWA